MPTNLLRTAALTLIAGLAVCTPPAAPRGPEPEPREPRPGGTTAGMIVDREADLFRDPRQRTQVRMEAVDRVLERFVAARGVVPDSLGDFLPGRGTTAIDFWHDGWGTEFRYTRVGEAGWRLRAAGADLRFCTPDDEVREGNVAGRVAPGGPSG